MCQFIDVILKCLILCPKHSFRLWDNFGLFPSIAVFELSCAFKLREVNSRVPKHKAEPCHVAIALCRIASNPTYLHAFRNFLIHPLLSPAACQLVLIFPPHVFTVAINEPQVD